MGRNFDFAPPEQYTGTARSHTNLPGPITLPSIPEGVGTPELTGPTFTPLNLPDAAGAAVADLPELPTLDMPDIFVI